MKKKLINFAKKQLTKLTKYVNILLNEIKKYTNKECSVLFAAVVVCATTIIVYGLVCHIDKIHTNSFDIVQTPENNNIDNFLSVVPNDHLNLHMSAGACSAIWNTVVVNTEETNTDEVGDITESEETEVENKYYCEWGDFYLTETEYKLLLTTVFCESGGEKSETQYMVTLAILNRLVDSKFPNNLHDIIYAKGAFSVTKWKDFENRGWTERVEQSVQAALKSNPHPRDMFYFRTRHYHSWAKNYKKVGKVYFSTRK